MGGDVMVEISDLDFDAWRQGSSPIFLFWNCN